MRNEAKLELRITIEIRQTPNYSGGLSLSETLELPQRGFMEMCQVLAKFQELADSFKPSGESHDRG